MASAQEIANFESRRDTVGIATFVVLCAQVFAIADDVSQPNLQRQHLRYGERSFEQWRHVLRTDLKLETRREAVIALTAFGKNGYSKEAVMAIASCLKDNDGSEFVKEVCGALYRIGDPAIPILTDLLKHKNHRVRAYAADRIGAFGPRAESAFKALSIAAADNEPLVRGYVYGAIGYVADEQHHDRLLALMLSHPKQRTRTIRSCNI